ncbi:MAG: LptF/LptG family permease [Kiritimatiellae bacterium]|nr:LptF/LptG family permease [Kiritimatiellia bacterium]
MRTIDKYVFGSFLSSFVLAFLVLSFVLTIGLLVQIISFILDGVEASLVGKFCLVSLPETLQWSMPLALLVASVLVFSRLSADSEIAAMKACGINLMSVMKWPFVFAVFCTLIGFLINNEIVPRGHEVRRTLKSGISVNTGLSVLEPGRVINDFPKAKIYFGSKEGNWLYDLIVFDYSNPKFDRMITAAKALVIQDGSDVNLDLYQMTIDPLDEEHRTMARFGRFTYTLKGVIKEKTYNRKIKDFRTVEILSRAGELSDEIDRLEDGAEVSTEDSPEGVELRRKMLVAERTQTLVEFNKRFVFAMASICFVLIGIPLGIRSQRKESSIGMAISLAVALGYYMVIILMLSLEKSSAAHPHVLIWLPVVVCFVLSAKFIRKHL